MFTLREFTNKAHKKKEAQRPQADHFYKNGCDTNAQTHTEHHSWNSKSATTRTNLILSSFLGALA